MELEEIKDDEPFSRDHDHDQRFGDADTHRVLIPQPSTHSRDPLVRVARGTTICKTMRC